MFFLFGTHKPALILVFLFMLLISAFNPSIYLFFFWRQKKKQKDRRPTPIKSTLLTKNFTTRYARTIKFF